MITNAANEFSNYLLEEKKKNDTYATMSACSYAETDNLNDKARYTYYRDLAEVFSKLHSLACKALHETEREMKVIANNS